MKRLTMSVVAMLLLATACQKHDSNPGEEEITPVIGERKCASQEVLEQQIAADPDRARGLEEIEAFTKRFIQKQETNRSESNATTTTITIPVVVHVVYNTNTQRISDAQVNSQIAVLNEDFNLENGDNALVPTHFAGAKASINIRFVLDRIIPVQTRKKSFGTNDDVKRSSRGGSDPVDPANYLNMWSCNLGNGLLGYAQFPGGPAATDGVVVLYSAFGSKAKNPTGTYVANYDLGRTATHEVGHWMNLRHIWGDATCGNDFCGDTPQHNTSNGGCPPADHRSTCTSTPLEMWMNYMDYTYDKCMYMFTNDQSTRMNAVFAPGGARYSFVN